LGAGGFSEFIVLVEATPDESATGGFVDGEEGVTVEEVQFRLNGLGAGATGFGEEGGSGGGAIGELGAGGFGLAHAEAQSAEILIGLGLAHEPVDVFGAGMGDDLDLPFEVAQGFLEPVHAHEQAAEAATGEGLGEEILDGAGIATGDHGDFEVPAEDGKALLQPPSMIEKPTEGAEAGAETGEGATVAGILGEDSFGEVDAIAKGEGFVDEMAVEENEGGAG
jgi:hypothetical protein